MLSRQHYFEQTSYIEQSPDTSLALIALQAGKNVPDFRSPISLVFVQKL